MLRLRSTDLVVADLQVGSLLYAEHVRQLGGASPLHNVMDVK